MAKLKIIRDRISDYEDLCDTFIVKTYEDNEVKILVNDFVDMYKSDKLDCAYQHEAYEDNYCEVGEIGFDHEGYPYYVITNDLRTKTKVKIAEVKS